ncbi:hypothetical protein PENTCL1PPCAC_4468, partial [Pristionchus entomophagus]
ASRSIHDVRSRALLVRPLPDGIGQSVDQIGIRRVRILKDSLLTHATFECHRRPRGSLLISHHSLRRFALEEETRVTDVRRSVSELVASQGPRAPLQSAVLAVLAAVRIVAAEAPLGSPRFPARHLDGGVLEGHRGQCDVLEWTFDDTHNRSTALRSDGESGAEERDEKEGEKERGETDH